MNKINFHRRKVIIQILLPTIASIVLLYIGYLFTNSHIKDLLLVERKNQSKEMVNSIYSMIKEYYNQVEQGTISKSEAQKILKVNIENLRYGEEFKDYCWLINYDNEMLAHPFYIDSLTLYKANPEYWKTMTKMVTLAKEKGEGYHEYKWQWKDDTSRVENKISYVKGFEPWEWVMGTGFYTLEVDNDIKALTRRILSVMTAMLFSICLLSIVIIRRAFGNLKQILNKEDELLQSEKRFRGMADNLNAGLIIIENKKLTYANKRATVIFDVDKELPETFSIIDFIVPDEKERAKIFFSRINNDNQKNELGFWITSGKNIKKYINIRLSFEHLNNTDFTYILISDNTKKKEIENQIKILSQTVTQSPDSVVITDLKGNIVYVNKKFCELTGYSLNEAIGQNPRILKSEKMLPEIYENMWSTISSGRVWRNELLNKKKNGELFWEDTIIFPIRDEKGEIIFYSAIKNNLTKKKQLEKELRQSKEKAERSEKIKTAFLNNISHEVNTPLNAIYGFAEILKSRFNKTNESHEYINNVIKHTRILIKLFNNIMKYTDLEAGNIRINKEEISVYDTLKKIISKYSVKITKEYQKNIEFNIQIKDDYKQAILISDKEWITKIFDELITNSIKFTEKGTITLGYEINYENITFFVEDTGVGIPYNEKESVMNSFTHGKNLYIGLHRGTGLGLNIIKSLATHLGGKMWFTSEEGKGTKFFFSLPSVDVKNYTLNNKKVETFPYSNLLCGKKVIIAEDNDLSFDYLESLLTKDVKEIIRVKNEYELLDMLKDKSITFDFILYDAYIPKLNNLITLQTIKSSFPNIPVVAMVSDEKEIINGTNENYDALISKPFSKNILYKVLKQVLLKNNS